MERTNGIYDQGPSAVIARNLAERFVKLTGELLIKPLTRPIGANGKSRGGHYETAPVRLRPLGERASGTRKLSGWMARWMWGRLKRQRVTPASARSPRPPQC
jgi:hypothetical protein